MSGAFAIGLENPQTIAQYAINIERYKMPKDYYQNYLKNLSTVTAQDVQDVARKYIDPKNAHIVVVGSKDQVAATMNKYGAVAFYDNYGQPLTETKTAAAPANMTAADVMKKYIAAIGGEKAINSIKDIKTISKGTISMGPQEIPLTITEMKKTPSQMKTVVEGLGMFFRKLLVNGDKGYEEQQGAPRKELDADGIKSSKEEADIAAELHPEKYGIKRTLKGMDKVNDADAYIVENTNAKGEKSTEYYDAKTGLLVKSIQSEGAGEEAVTVTAEYSDYKEVPGSNGYKMAYNIKQSMGPQVVTAKVESAEVNKNIADTEFN
jgi:hypothetical protein